MILKGVAFSCNRVIRTSYPLFSDFLSVFAIEIQPKHGNMSFFSL